MRVNFSFSFLIFLSNYLWRAYKQKNMKHRSMIHLLFETKHLFHLIYSMLILFKSEAEENTVWVKDYITSQKSVRKFTWITKFFFYVVFRILSELLRIIMETSTVRRNMKKYTTEKFFTVPIVLIIGLKNLHNVSS